MMPKHPAYDNYTVFSAAQAKGSDDDRHAPGYTAGQLANQVWVAMAELEFAPTMRIEQVESRSEDSDDYAYAIEYEPAQDSEAMPYVQHPPPRGINRFF
jgi:hypothetical protein